MDVIFNIIQVEIGCVTFMLSQHDSFIKCVKWVGSGQPALLTGWVRVKLFSRIPLPQHNTNQHANPN